MKHLKKILLVLILLCLGLCVLQPQEKVDAYYDPGYTIEAFDIQVDVAKNNVLDIKETITVDFEYSSHGIFRIIPTIYYLEREDRSTSEVCTKVKVKSVQYTANNETYRTYDVTDYKKEVEIKIGSSHVSFRGIVVYTIEYSLNLGQDTLHGADEFYLNLIGDNWDTDISNVTFCVRMPKEFDASLIGFTWDTYYFTGDTRSVDYSVDGLTISGRFDGVLEDGQALTIRAKLKDGYFEGASNNWIDAWWIILLILPIVLIGLVVFFWLKYCRDDTPVAPVSFYPPKNMNSNDVGYYYHGKVTRKTVTSLLVYWASKGYIKIHETKVKQGLFEKDSYQIERLKKKKGYSREDSKLISTLFHYCNKVNPETGNDVMTQADVEEHFYLVYDALKDQEKLNNQQKPLWEKSTRKFKIWTAILSGIIVAINAYATSRYMFHIATVIIMSMIVGIAGGFCFVGTKKRGWTILKNILLIMFVLGRYCHTIAIGYVKDFGTYMDYYVAVDIWTMVALIAVAVIYQKMKKHTDYGLKNYGKVLGFRQFIATAEKDQLETLVAENPNYYYDVLPYTYALDITDVWTKRFDGWDIPQPDWYIGDFGHLYDTMDRSVRSAETSRAPRPVSTYDWSGWSSDSSSSSSSYSRPNYSSTSGSSGFSGSSGGGRSGGGHGGGGGRRW